MITASFSSDVYMCTDSKVVNITELRLRSTSKASSPTCSFYIQHQGGLSFSVVFNRDQNYESGNNCGTNIHIANVNFKCQSGYSVLNSSDASTMIQYSGGEKDVSWCMKFIAGIMHV